MAFTLEYFNQPRPVRKVKNGILRLWWMLRRLFRFILGRRVVLFADYEEVTLNIIVPQVADNVFRSNPLFLHLKNKT